MPVQGSVMPLRLKCPAVPKTDPVGHFLGTKNISWAIFIKICLSVIGLVRFTTSRGCLTRQARSSGSITPQTT